MARRKAKPKATQASKSVASLKEDVVKGTGGDIKRAAKGVLAGNKRGSSSVKKAAGRAVKRLASRAGAAGAAFAAGHAVGSAIEKKTGIGKKIGSFAAGVRNDLKRNKADTKGKKTPSDRIGSALNIVARAGTGEGVRKALRKKK